MNKSFAIYRTPIGWIRVEGESGRLTRLTIERDVVEDHGVRDAFTDRVFEQVMEYLKGRREEFDIELSLDSCTPFQRRVMAELRMIPYAQTRSYKQIATAIDNPRAARAVGMANNRNPIHIIIPCHRVVGQGGALTGYAAGMDIKRELLNIEKRGV